MVLPTKADGTGVEQQGQSQAQQQQQQQQQQVAAAAALQWATAAAGYDEKQQADFAQALMNSQYANLGGK